MGARRAIDWGFFGFGGVVGGVGVAGGNHCCSRDNMHVISVILITYRYELYITGIDFVGCSPVYCRLYCPLGFKVDESGCEICECNDSALSPSTSGQIL